MREAFSFRLSTESTLGRERKRTSASQFDIGYGVRSSVRILATNEAKTHRPRFVKLIARGLSDSVMLSGVETHVSAFDVFPASAVHILFWVRRVQGHRGFIARRRGKSTRSTTGEHRKGSGWREGQLPSATVSSLSGH